MSVVVQWSCRHPVFWQSRVPYTGVTWQQLDQQAIHKNEAVSAAAGQVCCRGNWRSCCSSQNVQGGSTQRGDS